jgi:hypothetical protein
MGENTTDTKALLKQMSLEEKAALCCGEGFWTTQALPAYGIPAMMLTDGPHGLRKQSGAADHLGVNESDKTTCFPAAADILFGDCNPCGKLAETFPARIQDTPCFINFPGDSDKVEYREGIFVGYRYYDKADIPPLYPFGYGLSYTTFEYSAIRLDKREIWDTEEVKVSATIKKPC